MTGPIVPEMVALVTGCSSDHGSLQAYSSHISCSWCSLWSDVIFASRSLQAISKVSWNRFPILVIIVTPYCLRMAQWGRLHSVLAIWVSVLVMHSENIAACADNLLGVLLEASNQGLTFYNIGSQHVHALRSTCGYIPCAVSGLPENHAPVAPTPSHWKKPGKSEAPLCTSGSHVILQLRLVEGKSLICTVDGVHGVQRRSSISKAGWEGAPVGGGGGRGLCTLSILFSKVRLPKISLLSLFSCVWVCGLAGVSQSPKWLWGPKSHMSRVRKLYQVLQLAKCGSQGCLRFCLSLEHFWHPVVVWRGIRYYLAHCSMELATVSMMASGKSHQS